VVVAGSIGILLPGPGKQASAGSTAAVAVAAGSAAALLTGRVSAPVVVAIAAAIGVLARLLCSSGAPFV
jgi:hypothetical protein